MIESSVWSEINRLGEAKEPFIFLIDFEIKKPIVVSLSELNRYEIQFEINQKSFQKSEYHKDFLFEKYPYSFGSYLLEFEQVQTALKRGDSFLVNLTTSTPIITDLTLEEIFQFSHAKYKLWLKNDFVCFSPETFIQITENEIVTFPMKGTIDAEIPNAEDILLNDLKEKAEHTTIVDLLRNDLSKVAAKVRVEKFRFIEEIETHQQKLLQVSSKIKGILPQNYHRNLGNILRDLLPAGSISGAPKPKTVEIIQQVEQKPRGYYTGVFGYFDGNNLDSAVMIRYIEKTEKGFFYRSGGGIHTMSNPKSEYKELIDKIYVPIYREPQSTKGGNMELGIPLFTAK